jgi:hypothetical protein
MDGWMDGWIDEMHIANLICPILCIYPNIDICTADYLGEKSE